MMMMSICFAVAVGILLKERGGFIIQFLTKDKNRNRTRCQKKYYCLKKTLKPTPVSSERRDDADAENVFLEGGVSRSSLPRRGRSSKRKTGTTKASSLFIQTVFFFAFFVSSVRLFPFVVLFFVCEKMKKCVPTKTHTFFEQNQTKRK